MNFIRNKFAKFSRQEIVQFLLGTFPFILHLREYRWKQDIMHDIVAGICSGVIHVPQGMGFALLANVPPIFGLYTSVLPGMAYYIFGTSRHLSFGTMAVTALMVGGFVNSHIQPDILESAFSQTNITFNNSTNGTNNYTFTAFTKDVPKSVDIASSLTLIVGLVQLLLALLNGGLLASFMSLPFISGFTTAAAIHIMITQLPFMLGIHIARASGVFQLPITVYRLARMLPQTNVCSLISSIIACIFLVITKEIINVRFKSRMLIPIPSELIVVIVATIITHFAQLNFRWQVEIVGSIPMGLPTPFVPSVLTSGTSFFALTLAQAVPIAIVGFAFAVTMAKLLAERNDYTIRPNQELLACACANMFPAFFGCFAATQAPPRTMVHETTGCRSQLAGLISTLLPLLVVLCLAPLLASLPLNALGSVCFCALLPLIREFKQIKTLWLTSKLDCFVWIASFLSTLLLSITYGLIIGILLSCILILMLLRKARGNVETQQMQQGSFPVAVLRFSESLCFLNVDTFKYELAKCLLYANSPEEKLCRDKATKVEDNTLDTDYNKNIANKTIALSLNTKNNLDISDLKTKSEPSLNKFGSIHDANIKHISDKVQGPSNKNYANIESKSDENYKAVIIIDCSKINFIDYAGIAAIRKASEESDKKNVSMRLAGCSSILLQKLTGHSTVNLNWKFFSSVEDALSV